MKVLFSRRSLSEIREIFDHVAAHDPATARNIEDEIFRQCDLIGQFPRSSPRINTPGVRRRPLVKYPFTIFYRVSETRQEVTILAIIRGSRVRSLGRVPRR
jgi:plasmid stabilization system protein ParE